MQASLDVHSLVHQPHRKKAQRPEEKSQAINAEGGREASISGREKRRLPHADPRHTNGTKSRPFCMEIRWEFVGSSRRRREATECSKQKKRKAEAGEEKEEEEGGMFVMCMVVSSSGSGVWPTGP